MTFTSPVMLLGLLLIPAVIASYASSRKRRRRRLAGLAARGFVASDPVRRRLREHLPFGFLVAALVLLVLACARPIAVIKTPQRTATVVVALDVSNSMAATDAKPSRIEAAKAVASDFVRQQPPGVHIGVVGFGEGGVITQTPTSDHADVLRAIDHLSLGGSTSIGAGILTALDAIAGKTLHVNLAELANDDSGEIDLGYYGGATIVLISDGEQTSGTDPVTMARLASTAGVRIQTVGVGTAAGTTVQIDGFTVATALEAQTLENVARVTNGSYHQIGDGSPASAVSRTIRLHFALVSDRTEITALFAAGAGLLLAIGAAISLLWFGRVV
ncbi:MAG: VWA domain-containing protein [Acidimicrobiales bacterium]|jgi:Ca-activated chloride channel family protein